MIVLKIGGVVATDPVILRTLLTELAQLQHQYPFVLVHGGGKEVTAWSERLGLKAEFDQGIRLTSPAEMEVVDMVLGGKINIDLVRQAQSLGLNAVGLGGQDGQSFTAQPLTVTGRPDCRTGRITQANPQFIQLLVRHGYFPIVHSTSQTPQGLGLNINADEAAQELAIAAQATALVYISDIAGVLKDGQVLSRLAAPQIAAEIAAGVISGGMIPKVNNALAAVEAGVGRVIIGGYAQAGALAELLAGVSGTTIHAPGDAHV